MGRKGGYALFDQSYVVKDLAFSGNGFHQKSSRYKITSRFNKKRFRCFGNSLSCYPAFWITSDLWSYPVSES